VSAITRPIFPEGVITWTDRQDEQDTIWANDPNSIAAETVAIEATLGAMPQVEKTPLAGPQVTYTSVDARLSAMAQGQNLPLVELKNAEFDVANGQGIGSQFGQWNSYGTVYDPFGMYNGTDITIPCDGWWLVSIGQYWDWWSQGYHGVWFWIDGVWYRHHHWFWDFPENNPTGPWMGGIDVERPSHTSVTWQGVLKTGQRLRALSENGSNHTPHRAYNLEFKAACVRSIPASVPADSLS
jgi:hypothetical protein